MNIESSYAPRRQILTEILINIDSDVSAEIQDFCWDFRCHRLLSWTVSRELECMSHVLCYNFLWFRVKLTFQPCIWMYDWIEIYLYRMLFQIVCQIVCQPIHGYWHHIFTSETTQNEVVRLKILTIGLNRWTDGLNRWVWPTVRLTDRLTEIQNSSSRSYNISMYRI